MVPCNTLTGWVGFPASPTAFLLLSKGEQHTESCKWLLAHLAGFFLLEEFPLAKSLLFPLVSGAFPAIGASSLVQALQSNVPKRTLRK